MNNTRRDIRDREDLDKLMARFYERMMVDDVIGYIFTHYAKINLDTHLPILSDFWETILFEKPVYKRGPKAMNVHIDLAKMCRLEISILTVGCFCSTQLWTSFSQAS